MRGDTGTTIALQYAPPLPNAAAVVLDSLRSSPAAPLGSSGRSATDGWQLLRPSGERVPPTAAVDDADCAVLFLHSEEWFQESFWSAGREPPQMRMGRVPLADAPDSVSRFAEDCRREAVSICSQCEGFVTLSGNQYKYLLAVLQKTGNDLFRIDEDISVIHERLGSGASAVRSLRGDIRSDLEHKLGEERLVYSQLLDQFGDFKTLVAGLGGDLSQKMSAIVAETVRDFEQLSEGTAKLSVTESGNMMSAFGNIITLGNKIAGRRPEVLSVLGTILTFLGKLECLSTNVSAATLRLDGLLEQAALAVAPPDKERRTTKFENSLVRFFNEVSDKLATAMSRERADRGGVSAADVLIPIYKQTELYRSLEPVYIDLLAHQRLIDDNIYLRGEVASLRALAFAPRVTMTTPTEIDRSLENSRLALEVERLQAEVTRLRAAVSAPAASPSATPASPTTAILAAEVATLRRENAALAAAAAETQVLAARCASQAESIKKYAERINSLEEFVRRKQQSSGSASYYGRPSDPAAAAAGPPGHSGRISRSSSVGPAASAAAAPDDGGAPGSLSSSDHAPARSGLESALKPIIASMAAFVAAHQPTKPSYPMTFGQFESDTFRSLVGVLHQTGTVDDLVFRMFTVAAPPSQSRVLADVRREAGELAEMICPPGELPEIASLGPTEVLHHLSGVLRPLCSGHRLRSGWDLKRSSGYLRTVCPGEHALFFRVNSQFEAAMYPRPHKPMVLNTEELNIDLSNLVVILGEIVHIEEDSGPTCSVFAVALQYLVRGDSTWRTLD